MLSSCWLTSPFSGCFNTAVKGAGSGQDHTDAAGVKKAPQVASGGEKVIANGTATHHPPAGLSTRTNRQTTELVTTVPKKQEAPRDASREKPSNEATKEDPETPPMDSSQNEDGQFLRRTYKSEYRKKFRPFSQYQYVDGKFHKSKDRVDGADAGNEWYKEVLELRKQAGQYRCRGWGVETASDRMAELYNKQVELWEQVSRRSSLQALSLAAATPSRPMSKAEKEFENSRRSSPIKQMRERPTTAPSKQKPVPVHKTGDKLDGKSPKDATPKTGDGVAKRRPPRALSMARTPLTDSSRLKSPQKVVGKPAKPASPTKRPSEGRSVSVGPENRSPKRTPRPPPSAHANTPSTIKEQRRPRPTSLSTSSRRKDNDVHSQDAKKPAKKTSDISGSPKKTANKNKIDKKIIEETPKKDEVKDNLKDLKGSGRKSTPEPKFDPEKYEPVVKTPPEPTRVKSPDQVVKSPDPVNWTVPLDTGKTFTVTHNIPEGDASRGTPSSDHRPPVDPRARQTPEPTKIYQGSLAGTPITTAGTVSSAPSTVNASLTSTNSQLPLKTESVSSNKPSSVTSSSINDHSSNIPAEPSTIKDDLATKKSGDTAEVGSAHKEQPLLSKSSNLNQEKPIPASLVTGSLAYDSTASNGMHSGIDIGAFDKAFGDGDIDSMVMYGDNIQTVVNESEGRLFEEENISEDVNEVNNLHAVQKDINLSLESDFQVSNRVNEDFSDNSEDEIVNHDINIDQKVTAMEANESQISPENVLDNFTIENEHSIAVENGHTYDDEIIPTMNVENIKELATEYTENLGAAIEREREDDNESLHKSLDSDDDVRDEDKSIGQEIHEVEEYSAVSINTHLNETEIQVDSNVQVESNLENSNAEVSDNMIEQYSKHSEMEYETPLDNDSVVSLDGGSVRDSVDDIVATSDEIVREDTHIYEDQALIDNIQQYENMVEQNFHVESVSDAEMDGLRKPSQTEENHSDSSSSSSQIDEHDLVKREEKSFVEIASNDENVIDGNVLSSEAHAITHSETFGDYGDETDVSLSTTQTEHIDTEPQQKFNELDKYSQLTVGETYNEEISSSIVESNDILEDSVKENTIPVSEFENQYISNDINGSVHSLDSDIIGQDEQQVDDIDAVKDEETYDASNDFNLQETAVLTENNEISYETNNENADYMMDISQSEDNVKDLHTEEMVFAGNRKESIGSGDIALESESEQFNNANHELERTSSESHVTPVLDENTSVFIEESSSYVAESNENNFSAESPIVHNFEEITPVFTQELSTNAFEVNEFSEDNASNNSHITPFEEGSVFTQNSSSNIFETNEINRNDYLNESPASPAFEDGSSTFTQESAAKELDSSEINNEDSSSDSDINISESSSESENDSKYLHDNSEMQNTNESSRTLTINEHEVSNEDIVIHESVISNEIIENEGDVPIDTQEFMTNNEVSTPDSVTSEQIQNTIETTEKKEYSDTRIDSADSEDDSVVDIQQSTFDNYLHTEKEYTKLENDFDVAAESGVPKNSDNETGYQSLEEYNEQNGIVTDSNEITPSNEQPDVVDSMDHDDEKNDSLSDESDLGEDIMVNSDKDQFNLLSTENAEINANFEENVERTTSTLHSDFDLTQNEYEEIQNAIASNEFNNTNSNFEDIIESNQNKENEESYTAMSESVQIDTTVDVETLEENVEENLSTQKFDAFNKDQTDSDDELNENNGVPEHYEENIDRPTHQTFSEDNLREIESRPFDSADKFPSNSDLKVALNNATEHAFGRQDNEYNDEYGFDGENSTQNVDLFNKESIIGLATHDVIDAEINANESPDFTNVEVQENRINDFTDTNVEENETNDQLENLYADSDNNSDYSSHSMVVRDGEEFGETELKEENHHISITTEHSFNTEMNQIPNIMINEASNHTDNVTYEQDISEPFKAFKKIETDSYINLDNHGEVDVMNTNGTENIEIVKYHENGDQLYQKEYFDQSQMEQFSKSENSVTFADNTDELHETVIVRDEDESQQMFVENNHSVDLVQDTHIKTIETHEKLHETSVDDDYDSNNMTIEKIKNGHLHTEQYEENMNGTSDYPSNYFSESPELNNYESNENGHSEIKFYSQNNQSFNPNYNTNHFVENSNLHFGLNGNSHQFHSLSSENDSEQASIESLVTKPTVPDVSFEESASYGHLEEIVPLKNSLPEDTFGQYISKESSYMFENGLNNGAVQDSTKLVVDTSGLNGNHVNEELN